MNKIYRVVWNKATQTWAAVCEYAKAQGKSSGSDVVGEMSDKRMGGRFAYTMVMSGLLIATGQVAYAATVADGTGLNAIVIQGASSTATATGADSLAAGTNAAADGNSALAIGTDSKATGAYATAVGANVTAGGLNSITIGRSNNVTGGYTTVIGSGNIPKDGKGLDAAGGIVDVKAADTITATHSSIIGMSNQIAVSSVIGTPPPYAAVLTDVQVQGNDNIINRGHAYVFGSNNTINTDASNMELESVVAVGRQNTVSGNNSLAVGRLNTVAGDSALAVGINSQALGRDGIAIGNKAYANRGENPVALGGLTHAGQFGTALGARTSVEGDQGLAAATGAVVKGARAVAVGSYSFAGPEDAVALGHNTAATGSRAVAMGAGSVVSGARSGAWGIATNGGQPQNNTTDRSFVGGADSYAIGNKNIIGNTSSDSFVLGNNVKLGATGASIAITNVAGKDGTTNASTRTNAVTYTGATAITGAVALGSDTSVTVDNGVALGKGSVASTAAGQAGTDPLSAKDATASAGVWTATHAAVSVGNGTTVTRQITSVAAGTQDTDAVNVAQLKAAGFTLKATSSTGGEATTVADDKIQNGETVTVDAGKNIKVTHTANQVSIATKDEVEFTKITLGDSTNKTVLTSTTDGLDVGGDKITNVANGDVSANSKEAINGSQLYTTNQNVAANTADIAKGINFGDGTDSNNFALGDTINVVGDSNVTSTATADGVKLGLADTVTIGTANPVTINGTTGTIGGLTNTSWDAANITSGQAATEDQLKAAVDGVDTYSGWNLTASASDGSVSGESVEAIGEDETVTIDAGKNIAVTQNGNSISIATAKDLVVDSVTAGDTVLDTDGVTISNGTAGNPVSLTKDGLDNGGNKIANVADGDVNATSTDAVNGSQLYATNQNVAANTADIATNTADIAKGINFGDGTDSNNFALGDTINVVGDSNVTSTATADGVKLGLADTVTIGTANPVTINGTTGTIGGLTNTSWDAANITSGQAATEDQLKAAVDGVDTYSGWNLTTSASDGSVSGESVEAIGEDETVTIDAGKNIAVTQNGNSISIATAKDLVVDSVTAGDTVLDTDGVTISNGTAGNPVSLTKDGLDNGGNKIANVADGDVNATSTDAVNGSQLYATNQNVAANTADIATNTADIAKGINFGDGTDSNNFALGDTINVVGDSNVTSTATADGVKLGLADTVTIGTANPVTINGTTGTIGGLTNTSWDAANITSGQAATEDQLKAAVDGVDTYSGWNLTTSASDGSVSGESVEAIGEDETVTIDAGKNIAVTQNGNSISIATAKDLVVDSVTAGDTVLDTDGVTISNGTAGNPVSLTKDGLDNGGNKIANVADGDVNATSTDAVNGSQLYATNQNVAANTADIAKGINFGDGTDSNNFALGDTINVVGDSNVTSTATADGVKLGLADTVTIGTANPVTINGTTGTIGGLTNTSWDAANITSGQAATEDQLKAAQAASTTKVDAGDNIEVTSSTNSDGSTTYTVATAKDLVVDSVTAGDTVIDNDGVTVGDKVALTKDGLTVGDVSVTKNGLDNGGNKITNVAAGTDDTDAVNVSQLKAAQAASTTKVAAGDNIEVTPTANSDGSTTYTVATAKDLVVDSVTAGDTVVNDNGVTIDGGPSVTKSGIDAADTKVTNVAAGDISATSTDAVNGSQLNTTNQNVAANTEAINKGLNFSADSGSTVNSQLGDTVAITGDSNITTATTSNGVKVTLNKALTGLTSAEFTDGAGATSTVSGAGTTVTDASGNTTTTSATGVTITPASGDAVSLTESGLDNGGNTITNVAAGANGTDAVNVNQLQGLSNNINSRMDGIENNSNAGTAAAMAVAGLPQAYLPGKSMMAVAGGVYRGESGYAIGFSSISDGGNWVIKGTASGNSRGHYGATAGVGYQW